MNDRVRAEIVKWALWTGTAAAALTIATWPPGYPLRLWKWRDYERRISARREEVDRMFDGALHPR